MILSDQVEVDDFMLAVSLKGDMLALLSPWSLSFGRECPEALDHVT